MMIRTQQFLTFSSNKCNSFQNIFILLTNTTNKILFAAIKKGMVNIMNKSHYDVERLQNSQMKTQVKNKLSDIEGVQMVNVDIAQGSIDVDYNDSVDERKIRQTIEQIGCKIIS